MNFKMMELRALQTVLLYIARSAFADVQSINCQDDYTDCWDCLQRRWSPTKMAYCCTHAHLGCGPVTTTSVQYDCNLEYTDCWECLQHRWSRRKLSFCCATAQKGCGPVQSVAPTVSNNAETTPHPAAGKIVGGVLGGMAGATALGLLGGMLAHHVNETHILREKLRHESHVAEEAANVAMANVSQAATIIRTTISPPAGLLTQQGSSGSINPLWALIPLLLLLALCIPLLWWFLKGNKAKKVGHRHMADNDSQASDAAQLLESESTVGSQFVSYDAGQSHYLQNQDFSRASSDFGGASSTASIATSSPLLGTITPPRIRASMTAPKLVGWVSERQLGPSSSLVMEGGSASISAVGSVNGASVTVAPTFVPAGVLQVEEQQMIGTINVPMQQMVGMVTPPAPLMPMGMTLR